MDERIEFSRRLNEALDESPLGVPIKGDGRQIFVSRLFEVDQKGARKWLEGEGFPKLERCIIISKKLNVSVEWLLTGRGNKRMVDPADIQLATLLNDYYQLPTELKTELSQYAAYILSKYKSASTSTVPPPPLFVHEHKKTH